MHVSFLLTARVTNVAALRAALGRQVADTVVRRALRQVSDEAVRRGGRLVLSKGTRVMAQFATHEAAEGMAFDVDDVANALSTARGRRVETSVFVEHLKVSEPWWRRLLEFLMGK